MRCLPVTGRIGLLAFYCFCRILKSCRGQKLRYVFCLVRDSDLVIGIPVLGVLTVGAGIVKGVVR